MALVTELERSTSLRRAYWRSLAGQRRRAALFVFLATASGGLEGVALAVLVPLVQGADGTNVDMLGFSIDARADRALLLTAFAVAGVLSAVLKFVSEAVLIRVRANIERSMRTRSTGLLLRADWSEFLGLRLGDINTTMLLAAEQVGLGAIAFVRGVASICVAVGFGAAAVFVSPKLSVFSLVFGALAFVGYRVSGRRAERHAQRMAELANAIGRDIAEVFGNLKLFRSTGGVDRSERQMGATFEEFSDAYYRSEIFRPVTRVGFEAGAIVFLTALLAVSLVLSGSFSPSALVFLALFYRLAPRALNAQEFMQAAITQRPWFLDWERGCDAVATTVRPATGTKAPTFEVELTAHDLSYRYPGAARLAVDHVGWELGAGGCIAFVGPSGCGKTTILDVVTGLLPPSGGELTLDGVSLTDIDRDEWQSHIGLVMQNSPLFHGSVLDNVCWGATVDRAKAEQVLELANCREFLDPLPEGIDTVLGEGGATLSGGQRQRLALARALYLDPWLLLLDEATSALDAESEELVIEGLRELKGRVSMIVVTHRVPILSLADRIYVMEGGQVVEEATWEELRATSVTRLQRMLDDESGDHEDPSAVR